VLASLLACAVAGGVAAFALAVAPVAGADGGTTSTAGTSTVPPTETDTTTTTTTTASPTTTTPQPHLIAAGVTVGHIPVGGLTYARAVALVTRAFARPLTLVVSRTRHVHVAPDRLGASAEVDAAVRRALTVHRFGFNVPLPVDLEPGVIDAYAATLGSTVDREPVDSRLILYHVAPRITKDSPGRHLNRVLVSRAIVLALKTQSRDPISLPFRAVPPTVTPAAFPHVIVIRRGSHQLTLYRRATLVREFPVATGQSSYPTPLGRFQIVTMWRDPWWYPPAGSAWAAGEKPIPPGPSNPLGTRWMGLSAPYVGIHGTPNAASIGYSASHGCIRMRIPDAEWLFDHVEIGTTVFIVAV
jgi:lipoprotein-anchoring transpeptidase ErfK/SrfK